MQINWNKNPLRTTISLTEEEKEIFALKCLIDEYEERLTVAALYLNKEKYPKQFNPERAFTEVYIYDESGNIDREKINEFKNYYLRELESGYHIGDCTCFPSSCNRCIAEEILGVDTIKGLGKHPANSIQSLFGIENEKSLDEVLEELSKEKKYTKPDSWPSTVGYEQHIPRWEAERVAAYQWLKQYKEDHFAN